MIRQICAHLRPLFCFSFQFSSCFHIDCPPDENIVIILNLRDLLVPNSVFKETTEHLTVNCLDPSLIQSDNFWIIIEDLLQSNVLPRRGEHRLHLVDNTLRSFILHLHVGLQESDLALGTQNIIDPVENRAFFAHFLAQTAHRDHSLTPLVQVLVCKQ